jgi:hypothetical protein
MVVPPGAALRFADMAVEYAMSGFSERCGYLEANIAATAGQLGGRPPGRLLVNSREVLASTARVVGATLGEMHFNTFVALTMVYVREGAPDDGAGAATLGRLHRLVHGEVSRHGRSTKGGRAYLAIVNALEDLFEAKLTVQGYDTVTGRLTPGGFSKTRLLVDLFWDEDLERARQGALEGRNELAARLGAKRADNDTVRWRFHQAYVARIRAGDLVTLDWEKLRALRGVAKTLWLQLSAPRFMFRPVPGQPDHEWIEIPLTTEGHQALGVHATEERDRRRTLNQAGRRILEVDPTYVVFDAHGGPRRPSALRIVRRCVPPDDVRAATPLPGQLNLAAA